MNRGRQDSGTKRKRRGRYTAVLIAALICAAAMTLMGCGNSSGSSGDAGDKSQVKAQDCAGLFEALRQGIEGSDNHLSDTVLRSNCTFVPAGYWDEIEDFYYTSDDDQIYCVCIVKAADSGAAEDLKSIFKDTQTQLQHDDYLTTVQQATVQAGCTGSSGDYIWYICLSSDAAVNQAAESALKAAL